MGTMGTINGQKFGILQSLDNIIYGRTKEKILHVNNLSKLGIVSDLEYYEHEDSVMFQKRIFSLSWHPNCPYHFAAADKSGDIVVMENSFESSSFQPRVLTTVEGVGSAEGSIYSMKFHPSEKHILYKASLQGNLVQLNLLDQEKNIVYDNTDDWHIWYTAMDISTGTNLIAGGKNKGQVRISTLHGEKIFEEKLHKSKVLYCEFNTKVPSLLVTSSLDQSIKIWDVRKIKNQEPLCSFNEEKGINIASFNYVDGSKLMTSDQKDGIHVYQGPNWNKTVTISHPHRQFQHLTPIKAAWHPLSDVILIGTYPVVEIKLKVRKDGKSFPISNKAFQQMEKPIEFFDANSGDKIAELNHPSNTIISLVSFNCAGNILAAGKGRHLVFWQKSGKNDVLEFAKRGKYMKKLSIPIETRNLLRGMSSRRQRRDSDDDEDDDDDFKKSKKKQPGKKKQKLEVKEEKKKTSKKPEKKEKKKEPRKKK